MKISTVTIESFKRVKQVEFPLADVTILVGGNNSGKSSVLQGIHFAITTLQSARSVSLSPNKPVNTLGFDQLIFKPASDPMKLHHSSDMNTTKGPVFTFDYSTDAAPDEPKKFRLTMRRGKNANLSLTFQHNNHFYQKASDRGQPLSVFVPGLAGVALREERRTDAIVATGLAQGDANLYLRNILLRLLNDPVRLDKFHAIIGELFEGLKIQSSYDERLHQHIEILVKVGDQLTPLELVGTGTLQALQLVAYATAYDPAVLLLDEPDAHLHPSNQRLLAATLLKIAERGQTKIVLATHSRHIFDALTKSDLTKVVWLKNGVRQEAADNDDLSILLDLGALDSFELHAGDKCRVVVLTEDSKSQKLDKLLQANGFPDGAYFIQSFNGVQNINMCSAIAEFFIKQGRNTYVLIHRDSDCMQPDEIDWFVKKEKKKLPDRALLFLTPLTDVEHHFCQPEHVSKALKMPLEACAQLIEKIISANAARFAMDFSQKRTELKAKALRDKEGVPSARDLVTERVSFEQAKGKTLWGLLHKELTESHYNPMLLLTTPTDSLKIDALGSFAKMAWPPSGDSSLAT